MSSLQQPSEVDNEIKQKMKTKNKNHIHFSDEETGGSENINDLSPAPSHGRAEI